MSRVVRIPAAAQEAWELLSRAYPDQTELLTEALEALAEKHDARLRRMRESQQIGVEVTARIRLDNITSGVTIADHHNGDPLQFLGDWHMIETTKGHYPIKCVDFQSVNIIYDEDPVAEKD